MGADCADGAAGGMTTTAGDGGDGNATGAAGVTGGGRDTVPVGEVRVTMGAGGELAQAARIRMHDRLGASRRARRVRESDGMRVDGKGGAGKSGKTAGDTGKGFE